MKSSDTDSTYRSFRMVDAARGVVITAIIAFVGYFASLPNSNAGRHDPVISRTGIQMLLVAVVLQVAILFGRPLLAKFERAHGLEGQLSPWAIHVAQLLADGATVLLFALAVFGGIARFTEAV